MNGLQLRENGSVSDQADIPAKIPEAGPDIVIETSEVVIRRAPRFSVFLVIGALLGAIGALIATSMYPVDPAVGFLGTLGYLMVYGIAFGLLLGALIALIADSVSRRRARTVLAERGVVGDPQDDAREDPTSTEA